MIIGLLFFILLLFPHSIYASTEYQLDYQSTYRLINDQNTQVTHKITLTNRLANIYPTSYTISIGTNNLRHILVLVNHQKVTPKISLSSLSTTITIPIPNPKIGQNQTNLIQLSYLNPTILEKTGQTYEINLPKLSRANEAHSYRRTLILPSTFPSFSLATPKPNYQTKDETGNLSLTWLGYPNDNITILFGQAQTYHLQLNYYLPNSTLKPSSTEIALPPDTDYQQVYLSSINPKPESIKLDQDGNWIALYRLQNQEKLHIQADIFIQVYPTPHFKLPSSSNFDYLLKPTKFWPSHDPKIKRLAHQLQTPQNIYNYLVNNFVYNYNRLQTPQRLGALQALAQPQSAICTEFTDTFIALTRALGIPAREINGYAYTNNKKLKPLDLTKDVLHSWPEYYDSTKHQWLAVDPTWGNTTGGVDYFHKLDFNHLTFVRHGREDNYPLPAGAYKTNQNQKSISIFLVDKFPQAKPQWQIVNHQLINTGKIALINQKINLPNHQTFQVDYLPPYGHLDLPQPTPQTNYSKYIIPLSIFGVVIGLIGLKFVLYLKKL